MEPEKFDKKKFDDLFKNFTFSYTVPINAYQFPKHKQETVEEMTTRLDEVDETVDAMTEYPQAKKMLDKLYGKL
jgi:hypothetical protein